ncbi:MAG: hypothetical protein V3T70_01425 [Phycisphaerae bacterium]
MATVVGDKNNRTIQETWWKAASNVVGAAGAFIAAACRKLNSSAHQVILTTLSPHHG